MLEEYGNGVPDRCEIESGVLADTNADGIPDACEARFVRGDCDADGRIEISDGLFSLMYLFVAGSPIPRCLEACDANSDTGHNLADAVFTLNFLFRAGDVPSPPYPDCAADPEVATTLGCRTRSCE